jgi:hypothetical protein
VLLLKLSDQNVEPFGRAYAERMFTAAGVGTGNAVDYFRDVSHGRADLGGSEVFGWFPVNHSRANLDAYRQKMIAEDQKNGTALANKLTRQRIVDWGLEAAARNKVDLSKFVATAFVFSGPVDYFGRPGVVVVNFNRDDPQTFSVDLTGVSHEMGHGHGLTHSRRDGATSEYGDSWDIMSAYSVHEARSSSVPASVPRPYHTFGPGLSAVGMDILGWLDETRVWSPPGSGHASVVTVRPLHRRDLPGFLAIKVQTIYAEFRAKSRWDAAIPRPAVFLHHHGIHPESARPCSYLIPTLGAMGVPTSALGVGDSWQKGSESNVFDEFIKLTVLRIDPAAEEADIEVTFRIPLAPPVAGPGIPFGGVTVDGGGLVWVPGRGFVKVPPRSPLLHVLSRLADFQTVQDLHRGGPATEQLSIQLLTEARERLDGIIAARTDFEVPARARRAGRAARTGRARGRTGQTGRRARGRSPALARGARRRFCGDDRCRGDGRWRSGPTRPSARRALGLDGAGVEPEEPAQRPGRPVAGPGPLGVARLLRRAVGEVEAHLVGPRHLLQPGDAGPAQLLVAPQRGHGIIGAGRETRGQGGAVLDGLGRALGHERVHRVAGVAEQGHPAGRPPRQRIAIEQGPDEARVRRRDDPPDLRVPPLEGGERAGHRRAIGPVLAVPGVVLGPADEVQQAPPRDEVVHEMTARAQPRLGADLEPEVGDAPDRHQAAVGDAAGEARRLLAEQRRPHRRMDAVGADQHVGRDARAVLEPGLDAIAPVGEGDEPVAEVHALGGEARGDDGEQVRAVHGQVRRAVELLAERVEGGPLEGAAVLPAPLVGAGRAHGLAVEPLPEAEPVEDARRVRAHVDAAADLGQLRRLLVDVHGEAGPAEREGRGEAADPGAHDGDREGRGGGHGADHTRRRDRRGPPVATRGPAIAPS